MSIAAGQSCRILLQASSVGVFQLTATSSNQKITLLGGAGVIQADTYIPVNTGDPADMLIMTPLSEISYSGGVGSGSFFIINAGESNIALDMDLLKSGLPANASIVLGSCPDPLPGGYACQVRIVITNPTASSDQELVIPINLGGAVINDDNTTTPLPTQNGSGTVSATTKVKGIIQYQATHNVSIDNSFANVTSTSVSGVISNTGAGSLTINSLTPSGNILSIANDSCSGKTLGQGEMCSYTVNLDVTQITNSNNELITIAYTDEAGGSPKSATSTVNWTYTPPLPLPNATINISIANNTLNQESLTTILTITNTGNVALSNITAPTISPANPRVVITNGNTPCTTTLAVNGSCNYTVTYNPAAPSETTSIILSGITATHPDNRGGTSTTDFSNSVGVNLASIFEGLISSSGVVALTESITTGTVTFTNIGNYSATVSDITLGDGSSSNLNMSSTTCTGVTLAPNQSCNATVSIVSTVASGSGNGSIIMTYDNHNGTVDATSIASNISWLIGNAPSLQVTFASSLLVTPITLESSTVVTLTNNGRDDLTNIVVPTLSAPLAYTSGTSNGCAIDGTQALAIGDSCTLTLTYSPLSAQASTAMDLSSFSATYDNNSTPTTYTTNSYSITVTGLALGDLSLSPNSVTQNVNWVNNTQTSEVVVTNTGGIPITMSAPSSGNGQITTSGCSSGTLQLMESCTLSVIGNYNSSSSNLTINGVITLNYSDATGDKTETLNVTANYVAMPVVTGGLTVASPSLFGQNISLGVTESQSFAIALTNTTNATNNGTESISIPYASLMPSNGGGVTYSINTTGITTNPCTLPSVGNSMTLAADATCNYHVVITAGSSKVSDTAYSLSTDYNYYNYTSNSTTPSLTGSGNVTNTFNLEVTAVAELSIGVYLEDINNFDGIEQGLTPFPTIQLNITNNGTGAVSGSVDAVLPSGITGDFSDCDDLAAGASCDATLTMSTASTIVSANLNTVALDYNNGEIATTADFPSISYSVDEVNTPAISMVATVTGCVYGNGTSSACMNNPDDMGGTASSMKVHLTFTNNSTTAVVTSLSLDVAEQGLFTTEGYTVNSDTCSSDGIAANGGTCVIEYNMPASASTSAIEPDITDSTFTYDYAYTTPQGQNLNGSSSSNLAIDINVVEPVIAIEAIESIPQGESSEVYLMVSNLYQANAPSISFSATKADTTTPSGMTFGTVTCNIVISRNSNCLGTIETSNTTDIEDGYILTASAYSGNVIGSTTFNVGPPPLVIFVTAGKWNGNLEGFAGADTKCNDDNNKPATPIGATYKALLWGNNSTTTGRNYYRTDMTTLIATATGTNLVGFNVLDNSISTDNNTVWTGYPKNSQAAFDICNGWETDGQFTYGAYGYSNSPGTKWVHEGPASCSLQSHLYCVQQSGGNPG